MFNKVQASSLWEIPPKKGNKVLDYWSTDIRDCDFIFFGYPDDEGVKNNGGRPGAKEAPNCIRKYLYSMTPPLRSSEEFPKFFDFGNQSENGTLAEKTSRGYWLYSTTLRPRTNHYKFRRRTRLCLP